VWISIFRGSKDALRWVYLDPDESGNSEDINIVEAGPIGPETESAVDVSDELSALWMGCSGALPHIIRRTVLRRGYSPTKHSSRRRDVASRRLLMPFLVPYIVQICGVLSTMTLLCLRSLNPTTNGTHVCLFPLSAIPIVFIRSARTGCCSSLWFVTRTPPKCISMPWSPAGI
jgi:hypothetical protein